MRNRPDLRVLFPTTFSDACLQAGDAVAQLADCCRVDVTIAHVVKRGERDRAPHRELDTFLADRALSLRCRRVLVEGDAPPSAIADLCRQGRFDLVVAPASDRLYVSSLLTPSFRVRLMQRCGVPLWTAGDCLPTLDFGRPIRTVACLVDFDGAAETFLSHVTAFTRRFDAHLQVLAIVPPLDDGVLADVLTSETPLLPTLAHDRIHEMFAGLEHPQVDVAVGARGVGLRRLLDRCKPDILFVSRRQWVSRGWSFRFSRDLDRSPCPVVCIDGASPDFTGWSFQDPARRPYHDTAARSLVAAS
jgi:hypothetical protein